MDSFCAFRQVWERKRQESGAIGPQRARELRLSAGAGEELPR